MSIDPIQIIIMFLALNIGGTIIAIGFYKLLYDIFLSDRVKAWVVIYLFFSTPIGLGILIGVLY